MSTIPPPSDPDQPRTIATAAFERHRPTIDGYFAELQLHPFTPYLFATTEEPVAPDAPHIVLTLIGMVPSPRAAQAGDMEEWHARFVWTVGAPVQHWTGYRVELFGVVHALRMHDWRVEYPAGAADLTLNALRGPFWRIRGGADGADRLDVQFWRQRAYPGDRTDCFGELRWWPPLAVAVPTIAGAAIELPGSAGQGARAEAGGALAALRRLPAEVRGAFQGRSRGGQRIETRPDFAATVQQIHDYRLQGLSFPEIARRLEGEAGYWTAERVQYWYDRAVTLGYFS